MTSKTINFFALSICSVLFFGHQVSAASQSAKTLDQTGTVKVKQSDKTGVLDPEDPEEIVDPTDPGPSTVGPLRIDYVAPIDFGTVSLTPTNRTYNILANKIGNKFRGNFIQITDLRAKKSGWTLQVKQEQQFQTTESEELTGSVLSFDKGWANSQMSSIDPVVKRDTLSIKNIGQVYDVAVATPDISGGTWSIIFGATSTNDDGQPGTIKEEKTSTTHSDIRNSAVKLNVPDSTKVLNKQYQTKIRWILSDAP